jgi:hypothetical protein
MTDPASAFQPAIDALEKDLADLEHQASGLLQSINLLREKAGLPPRQSGWQSASVQDRGHVGTGAHIKLHSDTFTGKKLASAVREYLEMRKRSGGDSPTTSREIFNALKEGGFHSGAKDDATALVVLRTMLRKNTTTFAKLQNGKYGLRSWYPNLRTPKGAALEDAADDDSADDENGTEVDKKGTATASKSKAAAAS